MATTTSFDWSESNTKVQFNLDSNTNVVTADVLTTTSGSTSLKKMYTVQENNITVERYNILEIVRGLGQVTYTMGNLTPQQKKSVLQSLSSRKIQVINTTPTSGALIISALP